ncbi:poly(A)-specific ribonuclease [Yamadazyma tenuis]|uniref:USP domain-containing protein n=1 Tax=Candida tenuis (strain ATCC 10573 / BCRC 21748 / CBS 615 / JCM 9827 / NBRC 10315 / NRRL Y-1498 / VKM Y-70) TaxID=590646 RepID=G3BA78_CANTC|nr:uncharacterized protein CANTEDRAFT_109443 [Yamadazyma tenuis ATCC 10573]EGV61379.1 hypothetical protein CANTEDRAFT_109443 [Yamadazyma tenuis ATCC 10573]WEJ92593.1 poly(A)-specific ribonuclease [Yamadazyma tenuis]
MEGWSEILRVTLNTPISSVEFDSHSNLLWAGDNDGYVGGYTPVSNGFGDQISLYPYTKFKSSLGSEAVSHIATGSNKVYSLSLNNININNKRGVPLGSINSHLNPHYSGFNCMALNDLNNELIVNKTHGLFKINLLDPKVYEDLGFNENLSFINHSSKFLTLGKMDGSVNLFDPQTKKVIKEFLGHNNGLSDMDINGNYLVTSGYSLRHNSFFVDPLVNLYDLRMMKLLAPIPFPFGPSFVKFHPKLPNLVLIGSKSGNLQFLDIFDQSKFQLYQVDLINSSNYISNLKMSNNGEFISFNDSFNNLILWSFNDSKRFVNFPMELEGSSNIEDPSRNIPIDKHDIPLNIVGMPYYKDLLLSNYGSNLIFTKELSKLPLTYDPDVPYLKFMENKFDSNFNKYYPLKKSSDSSKIPFISDSTSKFDDSVFTKIPNCYAKLLIKYSKFGIEDFNFELFNKTSYSGLENNLDNSYLNSILQVYKYQPNFQNLVLKNLFNEWLPNDAVTIIENKNFKGSSLLNELGYLFDMLNKSKGKNVKISNFSEFLNTLAPPDLLNCDDLKSVNSQSLKNKILKFNSFFLAKLLDDFHRQSSFWKDFGSLILIKCLVGDQVSVFPNINLFPMHNTDLSIVEYLNYTMTNIVELPKVLSINVNLNNRDFRQLSPGWLSQHIYTTKNQNFFTFSKSPNNSGTYKLLGYVAEINNGPETSIGNHNLISFVNIGDKWYLFNDFLVREIEEEEVLNFQQNNKKPLVIVYQDIQCDSLYTVSEQDYPHIDDSILYRDHFALTIREDYIKQYKLLTKSNAPQPGSLIAIDAEFVILEDEKVEISSNGFKNLIQPKKMSLARISVIDQDEIPFIDDYIIHTQPIKDYITSFSGIEPGDLDPINSTKNLVTLQTSYRRLWLLLNLSCVFVGHGLQNDFRTINIHVPKNQIRDTSELYFLSEFRRRLSLKFLSYAVLGKKVQVGNHDSIEDAKFALKLFKKYLELQKSHELERILDNVYLEGQRTNFRVPDA